MSTPAADLAPGDLTLYDNDVPALAAGSYYIEVEHTLEGGTAQVGAGQLGASQAFTVTAPQLRIDPAMVLSAYPPDESTGRYRAVLPYVVLADPMLAFERQLPDPAHRQPWLAVLVFGPGELTGGGDSPTALVTTTVGQFLTPAPGRRIPAITPGPDVAGSDPCTFISVPAPVFRAVAPRLSELRFLAHCRRAAASDQAAAEAVGQAGAVVGVVVANRFPAVPAPGGPAVRNIAHLVALEGLGPLLDGSAPLADTDTVTLISLHAWSFWSAGDGGGDFEGLANQVIAPAVAGQPADLLLRLPVPAQAGSDPADREVAARLSDGYLPLEYRTATGEATFAWYRGPLSPVPGRPAPQQFRTADAARAYDPAFGVFDLSLAAAWQAGRSAALADPAFGQRLLDFRRRAHGFVDDLYQRLTSEHFSASQISEIDTTTTAQNEFLTMLSAQLLADAGLGPQPSAPPPSPPDGDPPPPDADPQAALAAFLAEPDVQALVLAAVRDDLDPVAGWLASLLLLEFVPFSCLVADEAILPAESARFGYLDRGWQDAMLDGALSLGLESSLHELYASLTGDLVRSSAYEAALVRRCTLVGASVPAPSFPVTADPTPVTCLLVRSALVTGWPQLAVRPAGRGGAQLPVLRLARLSPSVLLCLFWGMPDTLTVSEPPHGLRFGTDDSGHVPLRYPLADGPPGLPLGAIMDTAPPVQVFDPAGQQPFALRSPASRVLNLDPQAPDGLIGRLAAALGAAVPAAAGELGPADVALQMIKSPETLLFSGPTTAVPTTAVPTTGAAGG